MLKKLFMINYHDKQFALFVNENHEIIFFLVGKDNKYIVPSSEDYIYLNDIYNNYDYMEKYYSKNVYRTLSFIASLVLLGEVQFVGKKINNFDSTDYKAISISLQRIYKNDNFDRSNIDLFYNNEVVTKEDVIDAINNNSALNDYYKDIAIQVLNLNLALDPELNLRIYYENMKGLNVFIESWQVISEENKNNQAAYFLAIDKSLHICEKYAHDDAIVAHEFTHAVHDLVDVSKENVLILNEKRGFSLEEAMTQRIINNKWQDDNVYSIQQKLLTFFIDNVDEFNYHIYNENGIMGLINELKEKYPKVDIDYLIDYIDTFTKTGYKIGVDNMLILENEEFLQELFKIAISNIDQDDIYRSFQSFMKLFDDNTYYEKYSQLYDEALINLKENKKRVR